MLEKLLSEMDLNYFGTGKHKISFEDLMIMYRSKNVYILDVRTEEECSYIKFSFAKNIPLNLLPEQINNIPKNKLIVVFCSSQTRAVIAYTYFLTRGYNCKILLENINEIANHFKPGYVRKLKN